MRLMTQPGAVAPHDAVNLALEQQLEHEHREAIQDLAYRLWVDRGCPGDSSESDWFEAEKKLIQRLIPSARN